MTATYWQPENWHSATRRSCCRWRSYSRIQSRSRPVSQMPWYHFSKRYEVNMSMAKLLRIFSISTGLPPASFFSFFSLAIILSTIEALYSSLSWTAVWPKIPTASFAWRICMQDSMWKRRLEGYQCHSFYSRVLHGAVVHYTDVAHDSVVGNVSLIWHSSYDRINFSLYSWTMPVSQSQKEMMINKSVKRGIRGPRICAIGSSLYWYKSRPRW